MNASQWIELLNKHSIIPDDWLVFSDWLEEQGRDVEAETTRRVAKQQVAPQLYIGNNQQLTGDSKNRNNYVWWNGGSAYSVDNEETPVYEMSKLCDLIFKRLPASVDRDKDKYKHVIELWGNADHIAYQEYISMQEAFYALAHALVN